MKYILIALSILLTACSSGGGGEDNIPVPNSPPYVEPVNPPYVEPEPIVSTGSIELSWVAPTTRADGKPLALSEIEGYTVYIGSVPREYTIGIYIRDSGATNVILTDIDLGQYYVAMTTMDTAGRESKYSNEILKVSQ